MSHGRTLRHTPRRDRKVNVARSVLLMPQMSLLLENTEQCSHSRGHRRIRQVAVDLCRGCSTATINDIHDLTFAAAEICRRGWHRVANVDDRWKLQTRSYLYDNILSQTGFVNRCAP